MHLTDYRVNNTQTQHFMAETQPILEEISREVGSLSKEEQSFLA